MIAPIQSTEKPPRSTRMRRAHRLVVSTLLTGKTSRTDGAPDVVAWRAWLFAAWVAAVTAAYAAYMSGLLSSN